MERREKQHDKQSANFSWKGDINKIANLQNVNLVSYCLSTLDTTINGLIYLIRNLDDLENFPKIWDK